MLNYIYNNHGGYFVATPGVKQIIDNRILILGKTPNCSFVEVFGVTFF